MKFLIVIDMQNDFIDGSLGTEEAKLVVPRIVSKINEHRKNEYQVVFTKDIHSEGYLKTFEGKKLPIPHCILDTEGSDFPKEIKQVFNREKDMVLTKNTFGLIDFKRKIVDKCFIMDEKLESIELCGVCTDICVISNALILRAAFPNIPIIVDANCCAGSTTEKHLAALEVMKSCQIDIINQ